MAIIDDYELVLEGFHSVLARNGIAHVETFSEAQSLLDRIALHPFSVYIVGVELADIENSELFDRIRHLQPEAKIIINTMYGEKWGVNKMTEMKVDGVLYKLGALNQLLEAITAVASGCQFFCKEFRKPQKSHRIQNQIISDRELEVLKSIAKGYSTKEIGSRLFISENTEENHQA